MRLRDVFLKTVNTLLSPVSAAYNVTHDLSGSFNRVSDRVLSNGLHARQKTSNSDLIKLSVTIGSGSTQDPPGKEGLAHFAEHMIFQTGDPEMRELMNEFEAHGGIYSGATSRGATVYTFTIPKGLGNERRLYDLASQMVFKPGFDPAEVEAEKNVVLSEEELSRDKDTEAASQLLVTAFGTDIAHSILGTRSSISKITVGDLQAFHDKHYVASNAYIAVSGTPLFSSFHEKLRRAFGDLPERPVPEKTATPSSYKGGHAHIEGYESKLSQTEIMVGLPFSRNQNAGQKDMLRSDILKAYIDKALYESFRGRGERKLYLTGASLNNYNGESLLTMTARINPERAGEVLPAMARIIDDIGAGRIDPVMLEKAKGTVRREWAERREIAKDLPGNHRTAFDQMTEGYKTGFIVSNTKPKHLAELVNGRLLSAPPTLVTKGDNSHVQSYDEFKNMLPAVKGGLDHTGVQTGLTQAIAAGPAAQGGPA